MKMNTILNSIILLAAGATIGSAVTWKIMKTACDQRINEEVDSVINTLTGRGDLAKKDDVSSCEKPETVSEEDGTYLTIVNNHYSGENKTVEKASVHVISPEEYGENEYYDCVELSYYKDGILAEDDGEIIEDVDNVVGRDSLKTFGKYENDAVHVRNDSNATYYEILLVDENYSDAINSSPHRTED